jgi:F-type H+-transporting ATPase subunit b
MHRWLALLLALPLLLASGAAYGSDPAPGHEGEHQSDIFGKSLDLAIWTWVVFLLLFFILRKTAWPKILAGLQQREESIRSAIDEAHRAREEAHRLRDQLRAEMSQAHEKVREVLDEARRDGEQMRAQKLVEAEGQIQAERDRALREINNARDQARDELRQHAAQLATLISAKAIRRSLTPEDHRGLIDEAVAELQSAASRRHA